jgi:CHAT domain-containing protein
VVLCKKYGIAADTVISGNATEKNLLGCISDYQYIHLATHQVSDPGTSEYSGLVFSDYADPGPGVIDTARTSDGILYSRELYPLRLKADLVTLSACETGSGKIEEGEGVIGLVRGFLFAGARNIVFSYWKVGDRNTMLFMKDFYRHVFSGDSYSAALRKTKLEMIRNPDTCFPLIWGGFSVIGL